MKIASITVFCNEDFRLNDWVNYYSEYKGDISLHVIVNNGRKEDTQMLKKTFPASIVLESDGGNFLRACNTGMKYVLEDKEIDAILQVTNDVKFEGGAIKKMYDVLYSDCKLAIVGPVLLKKDSNKVEVFGIDVPNKKIRTGGANLPISRPIFR